MGMSYEIVIFADASPLTKPISSIRYIEMWIYIYIYIEMPQFHDGKNYAYGVTLNLSIWRAKECVCPVLSSIFPFML